MSRRCCSRYPRALPLPPPPLPPSLPQAKLLADHKSDAAGHAREDMPAFLRSYLIRQFGLKCACMLSSVRVRARKRASERERERAKERERERERKNEAT